MDALRKSRMVFAVPIQFLTAVTLLRYAYPIYWDGAGPIPSFFYSGRLPSTAEYYSNSWKYNVRFLLSYVIASALLVAITLFLAPRIAKLIDYRRTMLSMVAFGLPLATAAAWSVAVKTLGVDAPVFVSFTVGSIRACALVLLPLALLAGLFETETLSASTQNARAHTRH